MASTVKLGSVNFPKLLRHLGHRTNQVRDLVFARDPIYRKEVMTTKADSTSGRSSGTTSLSGPAVSFGYEESSFAGQSAGTNAAYHVNSPELIFPGLKAIQSPIKSRSGKLERTGHRVSGECTFYVPSLDYIKNQDGLFSSSQFGELESYDKLFDIERIVHNPANVSETQQTTTFQFSDATPGYELDRLQFKIKGVATIDYIQINGKIGDSTSTNLKWDGSIVLSNDATLADFVTVDIPIRDISTGDTTSVYVDGERTGAGRPSLNTLTATNTNGYNTDKFHGMDSIDDSEIQSVVIELTGSAAIEIKDIYLYKTAEWRIDSITDYRDEYMEVNAVRVRGDRTSRRRAYG